MNVGYYFSPVLHEETEAQRSHLPQVTCQLVAKLDMNQV